MRTGGKLRLGQLPSLWANWQEQQLLLLEEEKRSERGPNQGNEAQTAHSQTFHSLVLETSPAGSSHHGGCGLDTRQRGSWPRPASSDGQGRSSSRLQRSQGWTAPTAHGAEELL